MCQARKHLGMNISESVYAESVYTRLNVGRMRNGEEVLYILSNFGEFDRVEIGRYLIDSTRKSDRLSSVRIVETLPINMLIRKIIIIRWNFTIFFNIAF